MTALHFCSLALVRTPNEGAVQWYATGLPNDSRSSGASAKITGLSTPPTKDANVDNGCLKSQLSFSKMFCNSWCVIQALTACLLIAESIYGSLRTVDVQPLPVIVKAAEAKSSLNFQSSSPLSSSRFRPFSNVRVCFTMCLR